MNSDALIFDNLQGEFSLGNTTGNLAFEYYYLDNYVVAYVGLNAVGNVDMNTLDLANNPVKIVLSNDKHRYDFNFTDNSIFTSYVSQTVELGEYNYTILSDQLEFASTSGTLTITTSDRTMLFNCALIEENDELTVSLLSATKGAEENTSHDRFIINLYIPEELVSEIKYYNTYVQLYDKNTLVKEILFTEQHDFNSVNYSKDEKCYVWSTGLQTGDMFNIPSSYYLILTTYVNGKYITSDILTFGSIPGSTGTRTTYTIKYKII